MGVEIRLDSQWVVVELTPEGEELIHQGRLESKIRKELGSPSLSIVENLHGGYPLNYIFIDSGLHPSKYFALEKKSYVEKVLSKTNGSIRVLQFVSGKDLLKFNKAPQSSVSFVRGQPVEITSGIFSRVRGRFVSTLSPGEGLVQVQTLTLIRILTIPLMDLAPSDDKTLPPLYVPMVGRRVKKSKNSYTVMSVSDLPGTIGSDQFLMF